MKDQNLWDELLIEGWHNFWKVNGLKAQYYIRSQGLKDIEREEWKEVDRYILEAGLKRSYVLVNGERACFWGKQAVKSLIASHSPKLSNCLWSGKHTDEAILEAIDRFPWSCNVNAMKKANKDYYSERTNDIRQGRQKRLIKMRQHTDTGSDWGKVK